MKAIFGRSIEARVGRTAKRAGSRIRWTYPICLGMFCLAAVVTPASAGEGKNMQQLNVTATEKPYKYFQFFGFTDGPLVGTATLNGVPMHALPGESSTISNNEAQTAVKYGDNVIRVEITNGAGEIEYALLGATGDEDTFDPDHIIDLIDKIPASGPFPWLKEYRFVLEGPAFAVLKK